MRSRLLAALLCLLPPIAHAQAASCAEALLRPAPAHTVSARQMTIPPVAWDHFHRAAAAFRAGHPVPAEAEAAKALALAPRFAEVDLLRAVAALAAGRNEETLADLAQARALAPDLPWLGIGAAGALNNLHRYDAALTELATIPGLEATGWEATYERARAEVGLMDLPAALEWSARAVTLAPRGCTDARLVHANALHLAGRVADSIAELESFLGEDRRGVLRPSVRAALAKARAAMTPTLESAVSAPTSASTYSSSTPTTSDSPGTN